MASITDPVTIDRAYFETLVRRAKSNNADYTALSAALEDQNLVLVPKTDYDDLVLIARQFENLRTNLITGGVNDETIALLSQDDAMMHNERVTYQSTELPGYKNENQDSGKKRAALKSKPVWNLEAHFSPAQSPHQYDHDGYPGGFNGQGYNIASEWADVDGDNCSAEYSLDGHAPQNQQNTTFGQFDQTPSFGRPHYPRMCKRTIVLAGISENTTHEDITKVVRGGLLLEVYIRAAEHTALVSFLQEEDAVHFYEHSRKNDLYINHKRIFIKWADRHFHLAGHVAGKIAQGATRNFVIRRCNPIHTEDSIRDDLEHIHNLTVIKIEFIGGSCYIKTNSIHNAMFARTCLLSRGKYKGSKIEWDVDECQQPFETGLIPLTNKLQTVPFTEKPIVNMRNRFATLRVDDDDNNNESDDRSDTSTEFAVSSIV